MKVKGKTYIIDDKNLEAVDVDEEEKPKDEEISEGEGDGGDGGKDEDDAGKEEGEDADVKEEAEEKFEKKLDKATEKVLKTLGVDKMKNEISDMKEKFEKKTDTKISALIDLEKLMKKGVDEMTSREKILGFFQGIMRNDKTVLKALSEGVAADFLTKVPTVREHFKKLSVNSGKILSRITLSQAIA